MNDETAGTEGAMNDETAGTEGAIETVPLPTGWEEQQQDNHPSSSSSSEAVEWSERDCKANHPGAWKKPHPKDAKRASELKADGNKCVPSLG
jgi:hypothetical protein